MSTNTSYGTEYLCLLYPYDKGDQFSMKIQTTMHLLIPLFLAAGSGCSAVEYPEGADGMNRLSEETSSYLLSHADNPVNWYAWGEEAFAAAIQENKPIFLSIGYSSCHWCHVMEEECFENAEVAELMNETFICIKVDREERPDIDNLYMRFTVALTGGGGWPMSVVMTPDGKPFFAGTYIPRTTSFGRRGMLELIPSIAFQWDTNREALLRQAEEIESAVLTSSPPSSVSIETMHASVDSAYIRFSRSFDGERGGFGNAPKFPSPHNLLFLLRYWKATGEHNSLDMVTSTLRAIRYGGIYDQIGFGIHRYSTDREWLVPHYEKMLYDQALVTMAFLETYQVTGDRFFADAASEIINYVLRDMSSPEGAFYSSEDADSEGGEGSFYTWKVDDFSSVLSSEQSALAVEFWNISDNVDILHQSASSSFTAEQLVELETIREILYQTRESRPRPARDEKILADWNGLMIASLARASVVLNNEEYLNAAVKSFEFIKEKMIAEDSRLSHSYAAGRRGPDAFIDDYAFLIMGSLELHNATLDHGYLQFAIDLQARLDLSFRDQSGGGYFFTGDDLDMQIARLKESYDGALPSGNSVELLNLITLSKLTGESSYMERAGEIEGSFGASAAATPRSYSMMLSGILYGQQVGSEVLLSGSLNDPLLQDMLDVVRTNYRPWTTVQFSERPDGEKSEASVCRNGTCNLPVETVKGLRDLLL